MRNSVVAAAALLAACGGSPRGRAGQAATSGYASVGVASWYGEEAAGQLTASGERFDPNAITVAHRTLPLGSWVEVTVLRTGRRIVARVTDRGPGRADRIIDLSQGAAHLLGTDRDPLAVVRVRALTSDKAMRAGLLDAGTPSSSAQAAVLSSSGRYLVQVASFASEGRARSLAMRVGAEVVEGPEGLWRVRIGPIANVAAAQRARDEVVARGYADARLVPFP